MMRIGSCAIGTVVSCCLLGCSSGDGSAERGDGETLVDGAIVSADSLGGSVDPRGDGGALANDGAAGDSNTGADGALAGDSSTTNPNACGSGGAVTVLTGKRIADLGTPFDTQSSDATGPYQWDVSYGKKPELVPFALGKDIDVAWQNAADASKIVVVHLTESADGYALNKAFVVPSLGRLLGFTRDPSGNYYVATAVDEGKQITGTNPPNGVHRSGIVVVTRFDAKGCIGMRSDVDVERGKKDPKSAILINPMVAGSGRIAWANGQLAVLHSGNTQPDANGTRHQMAYYTFLDANTGAATRTSTMWVSHSFDQRLLVEGASVLELHLGDAYPRAVVLGSFAPASGKGGFQLFNPKGATGENKTFTQLGGIAPIAGTGPWGYLVAFTTDRSPTVDKQVVGNMDVALVRVRRDFATISGTPVIDTELGTTQTVDSAGATKTNTLLYLTDHAADGAFVHAMRPRIVALSATRFAVIWDRWEGTSTSTTKYSGTWGAVVDGDGTIVTQAKSLSPSSPIARGDDAIAVGSRLLWLGGSAKTKSLTLHFVDEALAHAEVPIP